MEFTPIGSRIIVEEIEPPKETESGLVIPDSIRRMNNRGRVLSVGRGYTLKDGSTKPLSLQVGNVILYDKKMVLPFEYDGKKYLIMSEDSVLAVEG